MKGYKNKIVGQTGEYLVAAELSRRGLIATTFTGNVPHYDIIASDEDGRLALVQVKAVRKGSWQFSNITQFCDITFDDKQQTVGAPKTCPVPRLVVVLVKIEEDGNDQFYILTWEELRNLSIVKHKEYLQKHNGIRPRRWDSLHAAISDKDLSSYLDKWNTIEQNLG